MTKNSTVTKKKPYTFYQCIIIIIAVRKHNCCEFDCCNVAGKKCLSKQGLGENFRVLHFQVTFFPPTEELFSLILLPFCSLLPSTSPPLLMTLPNPSQVIQVYICIYKISSRRSYTNSMEHCLKIS